MSLDVLFKLIDLQGHSFLWLQFYSTVMFFGMCFIAGLITKVPASTKPPPDRVTDMFYWLFAPTVRMMARFVVAVLLVLAATAIGREVSPDLFEGFGPLAAQPRWLLVIELLLLMDLASYWVHRLFHTVPSLWRFHAIHHSATKISWSTTARVHVVNEFFNYSAAVIPAFLLGFPIGMILSMIPVLAWYAVAAHTDWNPSFGRLTKVFASPRFHRWHHTMSDEGGNKNFSNVFSFWDLVFGTYYLPADRKPEVFGLDDEVLPESYWAQLVSPFRRKQNKPAAAPDAAAIASPATRSSQAPTARHQGLTSPVRSGSSG